MLKVLSAIILYSLSAQLIAATIQGVRVHESPDATRIVLDTSAEVKYKYFTLDKPERVVIDLANAKLAQGLDLAMATDLVRIKKSRLEEKAFVWCSMRNKAAAECIYPRQFRLWPQVSDGSGSTRWCAKSRPSKSGGAATE